MEALRVEAASKDFGGVHALRGLSFKVPVGERLAVIGPNGAGKTTLVNVITGRLPLSSGTIALFGQDITRVPAHRRVGLGISRSFQITSLFPRLTVLVNALLSLEGVRGSRFQMLRPLLSDQGLNREAQHLLEPWGLWDRRNLLASDLGYGEQRKLEIALSLASNPKVLLLDEPNSGLTQAESSDIVEMMTNLGEGITVILVAHDMDLVFHAAHRILVLHHGETIADGTPAAIQADAQVREIYLGDEG
jgi:branched-chain amino acid transport system ATP-binding protein